MVKLGFVLRHSTVYTHWRKGVRRACLQLISVAAVTKNKGKNVRRWMCQLAWFWRSFHNVYYSFAPVFSIEKWVKYHLTEFFPKHIESKHWLSRIIQTKRVIVNLFVIITFILDISGAKGKNLEWTSMSQCQKVVQELLQKNNPCRW